MTPSTLTAPPERVVTAPLPAGRPRSSAAARTRLLLEGPIIRTLLRLAAPNVVVNVVLIAVTAALAKGCFRVRRSASGRPSVGPRPMMTTFLPSTGIS